MNMFIRFIGCFLLFFSYGYSQNVMTISDAIVDYILFVDDAYLDQVPGTKGGCSLVDHETLLNILDQSHSTPTLVPGGSAVNMLKGLSTLGHTCTLIVSIGKDHAGDLYLEGLKKHGINLNLQRTPLLTGKCVSLVTPNGERTMRTYLGNSGVNAKLDLTQTSFEDLSLFHIEGYQLQHHELIRTAISLAKQAGARVSMDLASFETVRTETPFIWELIESRKIDLLFANKDEVRALTSCAPNLACDLLAAYCPTVVVTLGEKGCLVQQGSTQLWHPAFHVPTVDTTAAGDLFIGGFLHGYLNQYPLEKCAWMGSLLASYVVQVIGSEISPQQWDEIHSKLIQTMDR